MTKKRNTRAPSPPPDVPVEDPTEGTRPPRSDLADGIGHLTNAVSGVLTRLLGEKVTGVPLDPTRPTVSPEADRAIEVAGEKVGRFLQSLGDGLRSHPDDPLQAWDEARHHPSESPSEAGVTPLTQGVRAFTGGVLKTTEAALDKVGARRSHDVGDPGREGEE